MYEKDDSSSITALLYTRTSTGVLQHEGTAPDLGFEIQQSNSRHHLLPGGGLDLPSLARHPTQSQILVSGGGMGCWQYGT